MVGMMIISKREWERTCILYIQDRIKEGKGEFAVQKLEVREELRVEVKDGEFSSCMVEWSCQQEQLNVFYVHVCTYRTHSHLHSGLFVPF